MEGWPAGWSWDEVEGTARTKRTGAPYIIYGAREGCRRAAWAIEGGEGVAMDREALAMALRRTRLADAPDGRIVEWESVPAGTRAEWLQVADEAIRLLSFEPRGELRARIEELERTNERLTASANAALERANAAEDAHDEMLTRHTLELTEALGYANGAHFGELLAIVGRRGLALEERDNKIAALTETAKAAAARAEEAQMRAQKAEEAQLHAESDGSTVARVRALVERVQQDRETERFRRALDAMARGVAHMADAVSEMVGGEEGAP